MKIAYGNSRFAKKWSNKEIEFGDLCLRCRTPLRTAETVTEYKKMSKAQRDDIKDRGGFVLGHLREGTRKANMVACRSAITLDADYADVSFIERYEATRMHHTILYSTHSHTPEAPRYRLIIMVNRDMTPDEYSAVSRLVANEIGMDYFDDCTYEPHRLMYWQSTPADGEYIFRVFGSRPVDVDKYLGKLADWRDCSLWPTSSRQSAVIQRDIKQQQDPLAKSGVVGAFCRAYSIDDAIDTFLSDIYAPSTAPDRYDYIPADSSAGVVLYDGKWAYSHHATDPACDKLLNAFDLVRIHKFGDIDEKASFKEMSELAVKDERVGAVLLEEKRKDASLEFDDWIIGLQRDRSGALYNNLHNITLILENDTALKAVVFNLLADGMEIKGGVPWKHPARFWRDADDAQLISYVDSHYGTFSARNYQIAVTKVADDRSYHPVREFLDSLPVWDEKKRVDTLLIDYLGAEDNLYVRAVTRKTLCAAIARVNNPGVKFDYMLVLNGPQGIGKSTLISKLGGEWYTDSVSITDMNDKTAAEKLQGHWIIEIGELAGMKKADIDKVKAFVSRQDDKYRASFGRRVTPHPRQSIFFGTTNSEKGYLRDITGNRRFWAVKIPGNGDRPSWQITDDEIRQIWAETLVYYKACEKLYLPVNLEADARAGQLEALEIDDREGFVREYLDTPLPENWADLDLAMRLEYLDRSLFAEHLEGKAKRTSVSNIEIWVECFRKPRHDIKRQDSYDISAIMTKIGGWTVSSKKTRTKLYGPQQFWERVL